LLIIFKKPKDLLSCWQPLATPLEDFDVISHILNGLGADYDPLATLITTRFDSVSLTDLYGFLLSYEPRLEQHAAAIDLSISTANNAQQFSSSQHRPPRWHLQ
jgi:hypothetical protein